MLAIASAITNDNQIPSIPMTFNKMYANGTVINNCLSKETVKEYFPKPRASKTPDIKTPKDETIKLKDKILSPVSPISNMPLLALNKESKTFGTIKNSNVPAPKIAAMTNPDTFKI